MEQPRRRLPVPPHPPVEPLVVAAAPGGEAVGQLYVAEEPGVEVGTLQQVVGEHPIVREPLFQAGMEGFHVQDPLARKAAPVEQVVIDRAGQAAVRVGAPLPCQHPGETGLATLRQVHRRPGLQNAVPLGDHLPFWVDLGAVHGVEHGADHASGSVDI